MGGECLWPWLGNPFDPEWGMLMALIQKYWGILLAPDTIEKIKKFF